MRRAGWMGLLLFVLLQGTKGYSEPIGALTTILGANDVDVEGIGIVTGLNGTGDSKDAARKLFQNYLARMNYNLNLADLETKSIALVRVEATVPAFARPGQLISVRVSAINGAKSLAGGTLRSCALRLRKDGPVVVRASGRVSIGNADNPTTGRIAEGGMVEDHSEIYPRYIDENNSFVLILKRKSFSDAAAIANAINNNASTNPALQTRYLGETQESPVRIAQAIDAGAVRVTIPESKRDQKVRFISSVLRLDVAVDQVPRILLDRQSSTAVISGEVTVSPGFVSHRGLTVSLTPQGESPGGIPTWRLRDEDPRRVINIRGPAVFGQRSLEQMVNTLNAMGATTDDVIVILNKLHDAGLLHAEIIVE